MNKYIVWLNGEYDLDENGNVVVSHVIVNDYTKAREYAADHERITRYIATIENYYG